jgi:hypothetical protein
MINDVRRLADATPQAMLAEAAASDHGTLGPG